MCDRHVILEDQGGATDAWVWIQAEIKPHVAVVACENLAPGMFTMIAGAPSARDRPVEPRAHRACERGETRGRSCEMLGHTRGIDAQVAVHEDVAKPPEPREALLERRIDNRWSAADLAVLAP